MTLMISNGPNFQVSRSSFANRCVLLVFRTFEYCHDYAVMISKRFWCGVPPGQEMSRSWPMTSSTTRKQLILFVVRAWWGPSGCQWSQNWEPWRLGPLINQDPNAVPWFFKSLHHRYHNPEQRFHDHNDILKILTLYQISKISCSIFSQYSPIFPFAFNQVRPHQHRLPRSLRQPWHPSGGHKELAIRIGWLFLLSNLLPDFWHFWRKKVKVCFIPDCGHLRGAPEGVQAGSAAWGDRGRLEDLGFCWDKAEMRWIDEVILCQQ